MNGRFVREVSQMPDFAIEQDVIRTDATGGVC